MELTMQERKKLTMVKAQAYLKAGRAKKTAMLDDFCESTGYHQKYAARVLHQAGQLYLLGDCILCWLTLRSISRDTVLLGMALPSSLKEKTSAHQDTQRL